MENSANETVLTAGFQWVLCQGMRFLQEPYQSGQIPQGGQKLPVNEM
jgi:hypothetical protein